MKWYFAFYKAPGLEPQHQMQFSLISRTLVLEFLPLLQWCDRCILQPQLTGLSSIRGFKEDNLRKSKVRQITACSNSTDNKKINRPTIIKKQKLEEKQLYGYFKQQTGKISLRRPWNGYERSSLRERESLMGINHCRLFNAKSIFIHINSSLSNNSF